MRRRRPNYRLRSWRVLDALIELRVARRLGRALTDDEARRLGECQRPDALRCREIILRDGWGKLVICGDEHDRRLCPQALDSLSHAVLRSLT